MEPLTLAVFSGQSVMLWVRPAEAMETRLASRRHSTVGGGKKGQVHFRLTSAGNVPVPFFSCVAITCLGIGASPLPAQQRDLVTVTDPFEQPLDGRWSVAGGDWRVVEGRLEASGSGNLFLADRSWRDLEVGVTVSMGECRGPAYWAGIRLRADSTRGSGTGYLVYLRRNGSLEIYHEGKILAAGQTHASEALQAGASVRLGARVEGGTIEGLLDGEVAVTTKHDAIRWGELALAVCECRTTFDDFACEGTTAGGIIYGDVIVQDDMLPARGALVETYHSMDGYPSLELKATHADDEGRYYLEGLPPGERAYWVRACKKGYGGGTGWFLTVSATQPTRCDLLLLTAPPIPIWVDSAATVAEGPWQEADDPQCYGGSRLVVRQTVEPGQSLPPARCSFEVPEGGAYVLHLASGLYPEPHYWSPFAWRLDEGQWHEAAESLVIESPRYGDRLTLVWARTEPVSLAAGRHVLSLRPSGPWVGAPSEQYWTSDALAVERLPEPAEPETANASQPVLRWQGGEGREVVLQLSSEEDFSDGTLTVPHLTGGNWQVPADLRLADGDYWWRLKTHMPEDRWLRSTFGSPAKLTIDTPSPAIRNIRDRAYAPTRAVITWETDQPCESWLEWDVSTLRPRYRSEISHGTDHRVRLRDLAPATCYRYWLVVRDRGGERRSLRRQFLTPRGPLSGKHSPFGVFGQGLPYAREFSQAGVKWMSDYWSWRDLEPEQGRFVWKQADERMALAARHGLNLTVTFWGTPKWIRPSHPDGHVWDFTYGPDDLDAARTFFRAVARHCRGRTDWFLPWIEPNVARDPTFGFPRGYWASRPHAATYAAYERAAYEGAKAGNPDCRVVGMNTAGVDLHFIEKCYDEGAADRFDVMNVHYYAPTGDFERQHPEALFARLRELMARYGDAEKPIYCSEGGGASSGLPGTDEASQAANLVRIYVISIANGIDKLSWTFSHDVKPYGSKQVDMIMWMGLFRHDPDHAAPNLQGEPKPAYFAYRTMTEALEGSAFRRRLHLGEGVRAYRFDNREARQRVTVVWSEGEPREVRLPLTGELLRAHSHLGKPVETAADDGHVRSEVSGDPVFVVEARE